MSKLEDLFREELSQPAPEPVRLFAADLQARHGESVAAVLFYGSCLRKETTEGVLDFYMIVDAYRDAYDSRALALANACYPPNVFYAERETPAGTIRCKYAVLSLADFARGAAPGTLRSSIWARFCQPAIAAFTRDPAALDAVARVAAQAAITAVKTLLPLLPATGDAVRLRPEDFWQTALAETYGAETRAESPETIGSIYRRDPARFDRVTELALEELAAAGELRCKVDGEHTQVELAPGRVRRARRAWRLRKPLAKVAYAAQLLKTAFTFGDWLPYVLWKLERHSGNRTVPSERQRRHPLIFGWPLLFRVLWRRDLR